MGIHDRYMGGDEIVPRSNVKNCRFIDSVRCGCAGGKSIFARVTCIIIGALPSAATVFARLARATELHKAGANTF